MKHAKISAKIPAEDKEKIKLLVEKGLFESMTEFHRIATKRLLKELETYAEKRNKRKKKILETPEDTIIKEMKELAKFADELF